MQMIAVEKKEHARTTKANPVLLKKKKMRLKEKQFKDKIDYIFYSLAASQKYRTFNKNWTRLLSKQNNFVNH